MVESFAEELTDSPMPLATCKAMLEACEGFLADIIDDDPVSPDCGPSTRELIEIKTGVTAALSVLRRSFNRLEAK
jgi:hypothetical protein